jgi:hypothetical protein
MMMMVGIGVVVLALAALLFVRRNKGSDEPSKMVTPLPEVATVQASQTVYPTQPIDPIQPVITAPTVENQWTDENGHTWRLMSDGSTLWWNGSDWQQV